jgi:tetratricopeptide (TPR) repeat protein
MCERRALDLCERLSADPEEIFNLKLDVSVELGKAYLDLGDLKHASEILEHALKLLDDDLVFEENDVISNRNFDLRHINIRNEYARSLKDQGRYADAENVSRVTLQAAMEKFGMAHFTSQNEMRQLADIMTREGKFAEAESLHRAVIKSVEASLGSESLDIAYYLNEFAQFFQRKNFRREVGSANNIILPEASDDYEEAQQISERAVAIIESRLGKNHPDLGQLLDNFASLHLNNGYWEKAEPLFLRSLAINELANGSEHPATALRLNNYGVQLYRLGKYDQAEIPYRRALAIRRKVFGENHLETAISYNNLANLLRRQGKYDEAEECYAQTLRISLATIGPLHVDTSRTLEALGRFARLRHDLNASDDFLNRSYAAKRFTLGTEHRDTVFIALARVEVLLEQSKEEEARFVLNDLLDSIGLEKTMIASNEMLVILGEDRAINPGIPEKLLNLIASTHGSRAMSTPPPTIAELVAKTYSATFPTD